MTIIRWPLSSFQDQQLQCSYFCRVKQWLVIREADDTGVVQVLSTWKEGIHFPNCSAASNWDVAKAQHTLIFGAHVRTLIYLQNLWNCCSTSGQIVVCNCWVASSSRWWTDLWGCWHRVPYLFIIWDRKRSLCLWHDPNSWDGAFRSDCK